MEEIHQSEGFNLLVPFKIKSDAPDPDGGETLKITGIANFCGDLDDDSCIEIDLAGEVVVPSGMDVSIYKGNPQILWQHDRQYSCGVCDKIVKKKDGIYIDATIHQGAMEDEDWYRVKNGLVTRLSVGFRCKGGEFKEINGRQVYFITKSLLLEISLVSIPASPSSAFSVVKSLGDDTGLYSGDLFNKSAEDTEEQEEFETKTTNEFEGETYMKLKMKDIVSEDEAVRFKSLGLESKLEEEADVEIKTYIDSVIKSALSALKDDLIKELSTQQEAETSEETEETTEEGTEETEEGKSEEGFEETSEKSEEATEEEKEVIKSLTETINQLKAQLTETE